MDELRIYIYTFFIYLSYNSKYYILCSKKMSSYAKNVSSHLILKHEIRNTDLGWGDEIEASFMAMCLFSILDVNTYSGEDSVFHGSYSLSYYLYYFQLLTLTVLCHPMCSCLAKIFEYVLEFRNIICKIKYYK